MIALSRTSSQTIKLQGTEIVLPKGNTLGAAYAGDSLFIQQSVLRADGPQVTSQRQITTWNITNNTVMNTRTISSLPMAGNRCGRVQVDRLLKRVLVCEGDNALAMLDPVTLETLAFIKGSGRIYDFAVDQTLHQVFVVAQADDGAQYLISYNIADGRQLERFEMSSTAIQNAQIAIDQRTRRIGLTQINLNHSGYSTAVYGCRYDAGITCQHVATIGQTSQIAIAGSEVFAASGLLDDDRHQCLTSVNISNQTVASLYCSPETGVHNAVGALDGKYVIAYTGRSKRLHFKEETVSLASSVSVWRIEDGRVATAAAQKLGAGLFQGAARIVCSTSANQFLLFSETSNIAYDYRITQ
jgi:hypothetical protein